MMFPVETARDTSRLVLGGLFGITIGAGIGMVIQYYDCCKRCLERRGG